MHGWLTYMMVVRGLIRGSNHEQKLYPCPDTEALVGLYRAVESSDGDLGDHRSEEHTSELQSH